MGIRGAISVEKNSREEILAASEILLRKMVEVNNTEIEDIASVFFTVTKDLDAAFPAEAARNIGWNEVALMDAVEIPVPGSMPRVIRVLMHVNASDDFKPKHVYLGNAKKLRPDLVDFRTT